MTTKTNVKALTSPPLVIEIRNEMNAGGFTLGPAINAIDRLITELTFLYNKLPDAEEKKAIMHCTNLAQQLPAYQAMVDEWLERLESE